MRRLSPALLAAQQASSGTPYVRVQLSDRHAGVPRLRWTRRYTGDEDDYFHAAACAGDGALLRARIDSRRHLHVQRVAHPGPDSDFSHWTDLGLVSASSGVTLTTDGSTVLLCYVATDQQTVLARESTDNGASFGTPVTVAEAGATVGWLTAGASPWGVTALFYSTDATLNAVTQTAGVWGAPAAWSNRVASIEGLACVYDLDWNLAITGQDTDGNSLLWTLLYGDDFSQAAGTFSTLTVVERASAGSDLVYRAPSVDYPDVYRLFAVQHYSGSIAFTRPYWSHTPAGVGYVDGYWREPTPFEVTASYGVALTHNSAHAWLSAPFGVWQAPLLPETLDVSADATALSLRSNPFSGAVALTLGNDAGRYDSLGSEATAFTLGAEVSVSPGYQTPTGLAVSPGPAYWIDGWAHRAAPGAASVVLNATDGWGLLSQWRASRQYAWAAGERNLFQLLSFVLARVGLGLTIISTSTTLTGHTPAFTIHPGETGLRAAQRLLTMVPDLLFMEGASGYLVHPQPDDTTVYRYGQAGLTRASGDHAVLQGRYLLAALPYNHAQVHGDGVYAEALDWASVGLGAGAARPVLDLHLDRERAAEDRADTELRRAQMASLRGYLLAPPNCGQQLYDVVEVTDARAGLRAAKRRVTGVALICERAPHSRYAMRLDLGGA